MCSVACAVVVSADMVMNLHLHDAWKQRSFVASGNLDFGSLTYKNSRLTEQLEARRVEDASRNDVEVLVAASGSAQGPEDGRRLRLRPRNVRLTRMGGPCPEEEGLGP